jgi:MFS family permease
MNEPTVRREEATSLWQNYAFMRLWLAQVLSNAGTEITTVAIPLTAVMALNATSAQMGWLGVASSLPNLLFALFAGVWVDRLRRRPILVVTDLGRALLLATIPAATLLGHLSFMHLLFTVFVMATLTLFFTIASVSILPSLVKEDQLVKANSKLATSDSLLSIAGPGVGGGLIQILSAPMALFVDAASYVLSALCLGGIAVPETPMRQATEREGLWTEIMAGIYELLRTPVLRALTVSASIGSFGTAMYGTVFVLFLARSLNLTPAIIGLVFASSGVGSLLGAISAERAVRLSGIGPAIIIGNFFWAIGSLIIPLAALAGPELFISGLGQLLIGMGVTIYSVNQMSLRQVITPVGLFGRVIAARRVLIFGASAAGAALGGFFGDTAGFRATMVIGTMIIAIGLLLLFLSPVRHVRDLPNSGHK